MSETPAPTDVTRDWAPYHRAWAERFREATQDSERQKAALRNEAGNLARWLGQTYGIQRVWLFGSLVDKERRVTPRTDIDLAVEGMPAFSYYGAVGRLLARASRSVDLVDLEMAQPTIVEIVRAKGVLLYERP